MSQEQRTLTRTKRLDLLEELIEPLLSSGMGLKYVKRHLYSLVVGLPSPTFNGVTFHDMEAKFYIPPQRGAYEISVKQARAHKKIRIELHPHAKMGGSLCLSRVWLEDARQSLYLGNMYATFASIIGATSTFTSENCFRQPSIEIKCPCGKESIVEARSSHEELKCSRCHNALCQYCERHCALCYRYHCFACVDDNVVSSYVSRKDPVISLTGMVSSTRASYFGLENWSSMQSYTYRMFETALWTCHTCLDDISTLKHELTKTNKRRMVLACLRKSAKVRKNIIRGAQTLKRNQHILPSRAIYLTILRAGLL